MISKLRILTYLKCFEHTYIDMEHGHTEQHIEIHEELSEDHEDHDEDKKARASLSIN